MKQEEQNYIAGESANLYSHFENQHGGFTKKKEKKKNGGGDLPKDPAIQFMGK